MRSHASKKAVKISVAMSVFIYVIKPRICSSRQPKNMQQDHQHQDHHHLQQRPPLVKPLGHSTPRPYIGHSTRSDPAKPLVTKANIRDQFFQTPLAAPPLISSIISQPKSMMKPNAFSLPKSSVSTAASSKKYYETDLDLTIKVPAKNGTLVDDATFLQSDKNSNCNESSVTSSSSRVINISVTKSQSLNFDSNLNKENTDDIKSNPLNKQCHAHNYGRYVKFLPIVHDTEYVHQLSYFSSSIRTESVILVRIFPSVPSFLRNISFSTIVQTTICLFVPSYIERTIS